MEQKNYNTTLYKFKKALIAENSQIEPTQKVGN